MWQKYLKLLELFIRSDLSDVSGVDKKRYYGDMTRLIDGPSEPGDYSKREISPVEWRRVLFTQKDWISFTDWLVANFEKSFQIRYIYEIKSTIEWGGEKHGVRLLSTVYPPDGAFTSCRAEAVELDPDTAKVISEKPFSINVPLGVFNLFRILQENQSVSIGKCPECKFVFFNPTKRKQVYCSPACRNLAGVKRFQKKKRGKAKGD